MKEELEKLGIELSKLAKKYNQDYLTLAYMSGDLIGYNSTSEEKNIRIYIEEEELEKCL